MQINDLSTADLDNLKDQGYTASDLEMLHKNEVDALLATPTDTGNVATDDDPHADAQAAQDAAASAAVTAPPTADEPAADAPFVPTYTADVPADAAEQIKALKIEEAAAFKRLMDGEIDADAYQVIRARTETEADTLKTQAMTASIFSQANAQAAEQIARSEWDKAQAAVHAAAKAEGIDYQSKPGLMAALNFNLRALGADPKNENRDAAWFNAEAHRITKAELGIGTVAKIPTPRDTNRVDPVEIPPTLRSVPAAATGAVNVDEFAHMRNLSGLALERAHAAMTDAQRDRWMAE